MPAKKAKPPRPGFRRRVNPYYQGMNRRQVAEDVAKTTIRWLLGTVLGFVYWLVLLLIFSIFLLNFWKVTFPQILIYSAVLGAVSSLVYGYSLIHKKLDY